MKRRQWIFAFFGMLIPVVCFCHETESRYRWLNDASVVVSENTIPSLTVSDEFDAHIDRVAQKSEKPVSTRLITSQRGGVFIDWPIATALAGGEYDSPTLGAGAGLAALGWYLNTRSDKPVVRAVEIYNSRQVNTLNTKTLLRVFVRNDAIDFRYTF